MWICIYKFIQSIIIIIYVLCKIYLFDMSSSKLTTIESLKIDAYFKMVISECRKLSHLLHALTLLTLLDES